MNRWPNYSDEEIAAVTKILQSGKVNYWTGQEGRQFETEFAEYLGVEHAIAMANGTVTLEAALRAINIQRGDEVIVPARTYIATANAVLMCGGTPVFADIDPISQNITAHTIQDKITNKTKAVIPVHLAGWPCEMDSIMSLAEAHHIYVIEDCAQAHGAEYKGKKVGSWGHMASFSFCQDKIMSTGGEGGMVVTNHDELWQRMWSLKDHGKSYDAVFNREHPPGFRWLHESFGTNWRMTEMQAAIGRIQLKKLDGWLAERTSRVAIFNKFFSEIPAIKLSISPDYIRHAYYRYYCFVNLDQLPQNLTRDNIMQSMMREGCFAGVGSCPEIYREKIFTNLCIQPAQRLPIAKKVGETALCMLVDQTIPVSIIQATAQALKEVLEMKV